MAEPARDTDLHSDAQPTLPGFAFGPEPEPARDPGYHPVSGPHLEAVHEALRAATRAAHDRIEAVSVMRHLTAPGVRPEHYHDVLTRLHRHFARHEPGLMAALAPALPAAALEERRNLDALTADLYALGTPIAVLAPPCADPAPPPPSLAQAAGWLYVHEGTSLGGLVILHSLRTHLGPVMGADLGGATRYLARAGRHTAARWRETRALIAGLLPDPPALAEAITGAEAAFAAMHRALAEGAAQPPTPRAH